MHLHSRRPVLVLQHLDADGVGFFGTWMVRQGLDFEVRNTQAGQDFPANLDGYGGLAILGGEMSANDELPSLRRAEDLIRQAFAAGKPTIGHCLGGQLMARALGCRIHPSPAPEIGWQPIVVAEDSIASEWFGHSGEHRVYQWHYEAFELPSGARCLASSDACAHQAFSIGPHLGMQFHIEVDADKVDRWSREEGRRWASARALPTVQDGVSMREGLVLHLPGHQALAERIYGRWAMGLGG